MRFLGIITYSTNVDARRFDQFLGLLYKRRPDCCMWRYREQPTHVPEHIVPLLLIPRTRGSRDSAVDKRLATGWTVRGSNPCGGEIFRTRPDRLWGPPSLLHNGYRDFPGGKAAGAWRWPPTPSNAEVKEKIELYLYTTSGPSWPFLGWTLPLLLPFTSNEKITSSVDTAPSNALLIILHITARSRALLWKLIATQLDKKSASAQPVNTGALSSARWVQSTYLELISLKSTLALTSYP